MSRPLRLVACVNRRLGSGQRSCAGSGSLELIRQVEAMLAERGLDIPVVRRECLGRCEYGPVMRIAPAGPFFTAIEEEDLAAICASLEAWRERHAD